MNALTLGILTVVGGAIGGLIAVLYYTYSSFRQEKALIFLFSKEFMLLYGRCTMYFEQMLKSSVSLSTLYEVTDTGTVEKLSEIITDLLILDSVINLKADFFQVIRWAHRASKTDTVDASAQSKAMVFFMGDVGNVELPDELYGRNRYKDYKKNILAVLDYLERLNKRRDFSFLIESVESLITRRKKKLNDFINNSRTELDEYDKKLDQLRLEEKEKIISVRK